MVPTGGNLGFVANNIALRDLDDVDYVALVNNDAFVSSAWLKPLVAALGARPRPRRRVRPASSSPPGSTKWASSTESFCPPGDGRTLGVRVREVATGPLSAFDESQFVKGA